MDQTDRLIPPRLAAPILGKTPRALAIDRTRGKGPAFVKVGRSVYYSLADLDRFLVELPRRRSTNDGATSPAQSSVLTRLRCRP